MDMTIPQLKPDEQEIASSEDGRYRILLSELYIHTPCAWITRRDLHSWIWTVPLPDATIALGRERSVRELCSVFKINRPSRGHWARLRAGKPAPWDLLDPALPPDLPVPLVDFNSVDNGTSFVGRGGPMVPYTRLGAPTSGVVWYPPSDDAPPCVAPAVGAEEAVGKLIYDSPVGPPLRLTRRALNHLIRLADAPEINNLLGLYGLDWCLVAKLAKREGLTVPNTRYLYDKAEWIVCNSSRSPRRKYPSEQRLDGFVDLSQPTLTILKAEAVKDTMKEVTRVELLHAKREALISYQYKNALRQAKSDLPGILKSILNGDGHLVLSKKAIKRTALIRKALEDKILSRFTNVSNDGAELLAFHLLDENLRKEDLFTIEFICADGPDLLQARGLVPSPKYSAPPSLQQALGLAHWLVAAEMVAEAQATVGLALEALRERMARRV